MGWGEGAHGPGRSKCCGPHLRSQAREATASSCLRVPDSLAVVTSDTPLDFYQVIIQALHHLAPAYLYRLTPPHLVLGTPARFAARSQSSRVHSHLPALRSLPQCLRPFAAQADLALVWSRETLSSALIISSFVVFLVSSEWCSVSAELESQRMALGETSAARAALPDSEGF